MNTEFEAKFLNIDQPALREKLLLAGFICSKPRTLMTRTTLHKTDRATAVHEWWRVRHEGDKVTTTYKHTVDSNALDGTREVEMIVSDYDAAVKILTSTGLKIVAQQETYREIWTLGDVECCIDEWPGLKPFIEIEGPNANIITKTAQCLGFDMTHAVYGGVGRIYQIELGLSEERLNTMPEIRFNAPPR